VNGVVMDRDLLKLVTTTVVKLGIKTHRAEIVTVRTAKAIAALDGRERVDLSDVTKAMELALRHRLKSRPFEEPPRKFDEVIKELTGERPEPERGQGEGDRKANSTKSYSGFGTTGRGRSDRVEAFLKDFSEAAAAFDRGPYDDFRTWGSTFGKGSREFKATAIAPLKGIPIDAVPPIMQQLVDVDLPASLRASVMSNPSLPIVISPSCIRVRVRKERVPALHAILLDVSGSMRVQRKVSIAKRILKSLMEEAYTKRTYASLIAFRGMEPTTVAGPTRDLNAMYEGLEKVPVGGSTPFTPALLTALDHFKTFRRVFRNSKLSLYIISDGAANVFLTDNPKKEVLALAEEYKRLEVEVIAYHATSRLASTAPDYVRLFVESVGGRCYSI